MVHIDLSAGDTREADYARLDAAMIEAGFGRFIAADNKAVFHLPLGQYCLEAKLNAPAVHQRALAAMHAVGLSGGIVTTAGDSIFSGLKFVRAQAQEKDSTVPKG